MKLTYTLADLIREQEPSKVLVSPGYQAWVKKPQKSTNGEGNRDRERDAVKKTDQ